METQKHVEGISRDLYWNECDQGRQIDRLRDQVINLNTQIGELTDTISKLLMHSHQKNVLVMPIIAYDNFDRTLKIPHRLRIDGKE